jgi:hypothetical protein
MRDADLNTAQFLDYPDVVALHTGIILARPSLSLIPDGNK